MKLVKSSMGDMLWVYGPGGVFLKICGGVFDAQKFGVDILGISVEEINIGLDDAAEKNNDVLEFGDINGLFIYSRKGQKSNEESQ